MTVQSDMALLAAGAYWDIRGTDQATLLESNRPPLPTGWQAISILAVSSYDLMVRTYQKGGEIVIPSAGTTYQNMLDWLTANDPVGTAISLASQILGTAKFYLNITKPNSGTINYSFKAHSLEMSNPESMLPLASNHGGLL